MNRITQKILEYKVAYLNKITGNNPRPYEYDKNGVYKSNIGNYHLDYAYGGVSLEQMANKSGGVSTVSNKGHGTKRELYDFLVAFIAGIELKSS